jgi:hypothetical protein
MYKNVTSNANGAKVIEDKISRTTIKRLVRVLDETLRGLDEAFSTLSSISVNARHTKAPQSPRSDAAADAVEPQGPPSESALPLSDPTNNATDKSTPRFTLASSTTGAPLAAQGPLSSNSAGSDSLSSPRGRRSSGSSNLPLPSFRETPATPTSANNSAANSGTVTPSGRDSSESARTPIDATAAQYRRLQHLAEDNIQILTARAVEILTTLQKISAILRNEEYLLYLFWTAHAMLKLAPLRLPRVYEEALRLLSVLLQNTVLRPVLESAADSAVYQQLRERTALVDVTCLQELVLPGLYLPQTELLAAAVLSELNSSRCELVANTKARHVLWMLSFVPWLDAHLLHSDLRIKITPSLDHVIAALESSPGHFTTIADILQRYQAGNFDQNPALFLELIGSELYSIGFVPHAREVINLIAILCNYAPKSAWRLARLFASQPHAAKHAPDFRALVQEAAHRLSQGDQSAASFINELAGLLDRAASNKLVFAPSVLDWTPHVELGDPRTNHVITCLRVVSTLIEEQSKHRKESKEKRRAAVRVNAPKDKPSKDKTPRHHVRAKSTMVATSPRRTRDKDGTIRDKPRDKKDDRMSLSLVQVTTTPREGPKSASTSPRAVEPLKISIGNESEDSDDLDFDLSLAEDLIGDDDKLESLKKQLQMNFGEDTLVEVREDDEDEDEDSMDSFDLDMEGADDAFFKAFDLEEKESSKLDDDFNSLMSSLNNPVLTSPDDDLAALPSLPYEVDSIQKALNGLKLLESNDSTSSTTDPRNSNKTDSGISTPSSMPSTPTTAPSSPFSPAPAIDTATQLSDIFDRAQVRRVFKSFVEKNNLDKNLVDLAEALYDYRNNIISSSSSMSTKAKLIMQRFFPKSSSVSGSSSIPEALKRETIKAYEAALLSGKFSKSLFEKIESITTQILNRDYFPQFVKSDMFAQITHQN